MSNYRIYDKYNEHWLCEDFENLEDAVKYKEIRGQISEDHNQFEIYKRIQSEKNMLQGL